MNAVQRLAEIESARAKRIARTTGHEARQIRLAIDHLRRRMPVRPFRHPAHSLGTSPSKTFAADADAVAKRLAAAEHQIEVCIWRIDDDRSGRLFGTKIHQLLLQLGRQFLWLTSFWLVLGWECRSDG